MNSKKITLIDYNIGNINSIFRILVKLGFDVNVASDYSGIKDAEKLILPGVGHFERAVENLNKLNLWEIINRKVLIEKIPILGICLGMQLMCKNSEEGKSNGFGWFDANIIRFNIPNNKKFKIPHIGWNSVKIKKDNCLTGKLDNENEFYFVHSYHLLCNDKNDVLAETKYDYYFPSIIKKDNIMGTQFHPEKSHHFGEIILRNFGNSI
tara:strand:+ start:521 stop:1147 length:627 start_codon:yes stop_codon:yes gene_type:complete